MTRRGEPAAIEPQISNCGCNSRMRLMATPAAAVRVSTPSFTYTRSRCFLAVAGLLPRISPMSLLVLPLTTQYSTSASRAVSFRLRLMASITPVSDTSRMTIIHSSPSSSLLVCWCRRSVRLLAPCTTDSAGGSMPRWRASGVWLRSHSSTAGGVSGARVSQ